MVLRFLTHGTALLRATLYAIRVRTAGCILDAAGNKGSHRPWTRESPYPVAHHALGHGSSPLQVWHSHPGLFPIGWSQIWALWCIPPAGRWPQSLDRCHNTRGDHPFLELLGSWESWDQQSEQQWESSIYIITTITCIGAQCNIASFYALSRTPWWRTGIPMQHNCSTSGSHLKTECPGSQSSPSAKFCKFLTQREWSCCVIQPIAATTINTQHCLFGIRNSGNLWPHWYLNIK